MWSHPGDNTCAQNDPFTSCSLLANNQGCGYSFNSGTNTIHYLTLETFDQNPGLSSTTMNCTLQRWLQWLAGCDRRGLLHQWRRYRCLMPA
ncbi:MAG: hypothetical protein IPG10_06660 [Flavobacteriales bacterium]|nr:hypothetical protein [Flavobacteriales bacterium]